MLQDKDQFSIMFVILLSFDLALKYVEFLFNYEVVTVFFK